MCRLWLFRSKPSFNCIGSASPTQLTQPWPWFSSCTGPIIDKSIDSLFVVESLLGSHTVFRDKIGILWPVLLSSANSSRSDLSLLSGHVTHWENRVGYVWNWARFLRSFEHSVRCFIPRPNTFSFLGHQRLILPPIRLISWRFSISLSSANVALCVVVIPLRICYLLSDLDCLGRNIFNILCEHFLWIIIFRIDISTRFLLVFIISLEFNFGLSLLIIFSFLNDACLWIGLFCVVSFWVDWVSTVRLVFIFGRNFIIFAHGVSVTWHFIFGSRFLDRQARFLCRQNNTLLFLLLFVFELLPRGIIEFELNCWTRQVNIFFQLEREFILQSVLNVTPSVDTVFDSAADDNIIPSLPQRYRDIILSDDWYIPGKAQRKKRSHRKSHGKISFSGK